MDEPGRIYCIGCGSDLTSKPTDRRSLQSSASNHVATIWKGLHKQIVDRQEFVTDTDSDTIISGGGDPEQGGKMCRKCFTAYERYKALQESLLSKLKRALDVHPSRLSTKRPRLDEAERSTPLPPLQLGSSSSSASPDVTVSYWVYTSKLHNFFIFFI